MPESLPPKQTCPYLLFQDDFLKEARIFSLWHVLSSVAPSLNANKTEAKINRPPYLTLLVLEALAHWEGSSIAHISTTTTWFIGASIRSQHQLP